MLTEYIPPWLVEFAQDVSPLLTAVALIYIGYAVEKNYTSRPALFSNGFALVVYFLTYLIPNRRIFEAWMAPIEIGSQVVYPAWVGIEIYVFLSVIAGFYGMDSYSSSRTNRGGFYDFTHSFYNSAVVGMVIFGTFALTY